MGPLVPAVRYTTYTQTRMPEHMRPRCLTPTNRTWDRRMHVPTPMQARVVFCTLFGCQATRTCPVLAGFDSERARGPRCFTRRYQLDLGCLDERKSPQKLSESHEWHPPTDRQVDISDAIVCARSCRGANTAPENAPQTHTPRQTQNAERRTRTTSELQPTAATVRLDLDLFDIVL